MSELVFTGLMARCLEPDALGRFITASDTRPSRHFKRFFDEAAFDGARAETAHTGVLSEPAACALVDCVLQAGEVFGGLDVPAGEADGFPARFLELAALALDDERAAQRLLDGGVLDRLGSGRHFFGSLPLRVIARQFTPTTREAVARTHLRGGWDEDLLNLLESAVLRASRHPEDLLVLVPSFRVVDRHAPAAPDERRLERRPLVDVGAALVELVRRGATDLELTPGHPITFARHGVRTTPPGPALSADEVEAFCSTLLEAAHRERLERDGRLVHGFAVEGLGPLRLSVVATVTGLTASVRAFHVAPRLLELGFPAEVMQPLAGIARGLVVLAAPPGQGRTTLGTALVEALSETGSAGLAFDEPACLVSARSAVRHLEPSGPRARETMLSAARALPSCAVLVDLLDDELAADVALELAAEGRLVVLTLRAPSGGQALHRLAALDARRFRRRLSESLAAVATVRLLPGREGLVHAAELLRPTEALRRHLRGNETPAPPVLLEPEGLSLDDRLLSAVRRGVLDRETTRPWLTDPRPLDEEAPPR
jgi:twitching motility protein PilT